MKNAAAQLQEEIRNEVVSQEKRKIVRPYLQMEEVRKAYPHPITLIESINRIGDHDAYCVNGALMRFVGSDPDFGLKNDGWFPLIPEAAPEVRRLNPNLDIALSEEICGRIHAMNDRGNFEGAWQALKEALEYGRDVEPRQSAEDQR